MRTIVFALATGFLSLVQINAATDLSWKVLTVPSKNSDTLTIAAAKSAAPIIVDTNDFAVVSLAANLFADDVQRVTGCRPSITNAPSGMPQLIVVGTLGHSACVDSLARIGKLKNLDRIRNHWESTICQIVENPFPHVDRALVIVGSDRRGAAYGLMELSEKIGVSPWYWWADVPVQHHDALAIRMDSPQVDEPGVKYRGIFINDEDWGLYPWAAKTFDPKFGNIGPKTYEKVFELMLRLRLNYIWPAMHACSAEFASAPENIALADKFGIVAGSSHCEPMLCNNVHWSENERGRWNYSLNPDAIRAYWEESVKSRHSQEAVWTIGIRGIHDAGMETPPAKLPDKIDLMTQVISDQRTMLQQVVNKQWGPIAQCFVPYKEVLPIYDAGLKVPDDVTLVWVDDNFGYIRRLGTPAERRRSGGAGVYWHLSYYGYPHSYTWINTTAPALMWEELHKAWENEARTLWVINVGDIKPEEIGIDYFSRLAWNPEAFNLGAQREFLSEFVTKTFGQKYVLPMADLLMEFYHLGTLRKPELMTRAWAVSLTEEDARELEQHYDSLLAGEKTLAGMLPAEAHDAYEELIGFPAHVLAETGLIFLADRKIRQGIEPSANEKEISELRSDLESQVYIFNAEIAGGKWNHIMPGLVTGNELTAWSSQVRWPWGEPESAKRAANPDDSSLNRVWSDAASADHVTAQGVANWSAVEGLGVSGRAISLQPANLTASWKENDTNAPSLEFKFKSRAGDAVAFVDFLPTFRICPGMNLRVGVNVDDGPPTFIEVPGSSGAESETGTIRSSAVQNNFTRARVEIPDLTAGKHVFRIRAVDPGIVIDRVSLPLVVEKASSAPKL